MQTRYYFSRRLGRLYRDRPNDMSPPMTWIVEQHYLEPPRWFHIGTWNLPSSNGLVGFDAWWVPKDLRQISTEDAAMRVFERSKGEEMERIEVAN